MCITLCGNYPAKARIGTVQPALGALRACLSGHPADRDEFKTAYYFELGQP